MLIMLSLVCVCVLWKWLVAEMWYKDILAQEVKNARHKGDVLYGSNMQPVFADLTQLKSIRADAVPQRGDAKRLVFVGTVHGCYDERKLAW